LPSGRSTPRLGSTGPTLPPGSGPLDRTGALALLLFGALVVGTSAALLWPRQQPALACAPDQVRWSAQGVATCELPAMPGPTPAGAALTIGRKLDLNAATEAELLLAPGVGRRLARQLVEARSERGRFTTWDEVDEVAGVGPSKLAALRAIADIVP
jgi:competence protein ComEA